MPAAPNCGSAIQSSKNTPQSSKSLATNEENRKTKSFRRIYHHLFRLRESKPEIAISEQEKPQASCQALATPNKERSCCLRRIASRTKKRSVPEPTPEVQLDPNLIDEDAFGTNRLLAMCAHTLRPDEVESLQEEEEDHVDIDPPTEEQIASLARRERENPHPLVNNPCIALSIPEPEFEGTGRRFHKTPYRPVDPTLLNPHWTPKPCIRSATERRNSSSLSESWSPEDIAFRNLLRGMLNDDVIAQLVKEDQDEDEEEAGILAVDDESDKEVKATVHILLDGLIDKAVQEVWLQEARVGIEKPEWGCDAPEDNEAELYYEEVKNLGAFKVLEGSGLEEQAVDAVLQRHVEILVELVMANEKGLSEDDLSTARESILSQQDNLF
ncbi:hypothetical protein PRK78_004762 [Emydomyces testavorans]|uniref:Uncharacterized protein n=1 Tax=Emydomyces testavorans TaxID=2070801 RepID=A0AAF0IJH5_9EURO|nr:hypothetical protein PRK78_004762 [Emydomyces testavorans]